MTSTKNKLFCYLRFHLKTFTSAVFNLFFQDDIKLTRTILPLQQQQQQQQQQQRGDDGYATV